MCSRGSEGLTLPTANKTAEKKMDVKNPLNIPLTQTHLFDWVRHVQGVLKVKLSRDL